MGDAGRKVRRYVVRHGADVLAKVLEVLKDPEGVMQVGKGASKG